MSTANAWHGALGGPFCDHLFASILSSVLDPFWARLGIFRRSSRANMVPKFILKRALLEDVAAHEIIKKRNENTVFYPTEEVQDRPKIGPRRLQEG